MMYYIVTKYAVHDFYQLLCPTDGYGKAKDTCSILCKRTSNDNVTGRINDGEFLTCFVDGNYHMNWHVYI